LHAGRSRLGRDLAQPGRDHALIRGAGVLDENRGLARIAAKCRQ
jgi:hypothetical protein